MTILQKAFEWLSVKFDAWLSKIDEENQPERRDFDYMPEESQLFTNSDRIVDEKGDFGGRYLRY